MCQGLDDGALGRLPVHVSPQKSVSNLLGAGPMLAANPTSSDVQLKFVATNPGRCPGLEHGMAVFLLWISLGNRCEKDINKSVLLELSRFSFKVQRCQWPFWPRCESFPGIGHSYCRMTRHPAAVFGWAGRDGKEQRLMQYHGLGVKGNRNTTQVPSGNLT